MVDLAGRVSSTPGRRDRWIRHSGKKIAGVGGEGETPRQRRQFGVLSGGVGPLMTRPRVFPIRSCITVRSWCLPGPIFTVRRNPLSAQGAGSGGTSCRSKVYPRASPPSSPRDRWRGPRTSPDQPRWRPHAFGRSRQSHGHLGPGDPDAARGDPLARSRSRPAWMGVLGS